MKRLSIEDYAREETLTPFKKTREDLAGSGPTDQCRAPLLSPLRAAGTPLSSRRRVRNEEEEEDMGSSARKRNNSNNNNSNNNNNNNNNSNYINGSNSNSASRNIQKQIAEADVFVPSSSFCFVPTQNMYTAQQVAAIVNGAVKDREKVLREEFEQLLAERLDDQWRSFAKFNEDQLHQKLEKSQYDYFS